MNYRTPARYLFAAIFTLITAGEIFAQQSTESPLPLRRIFMKPYLAGTRPAGQKISPDGKFIIFRWDSTANNKYRYWFMRADGSGMHLIPDTLLGEVEWSPDSKTIACTRKGDIFLTDTAFHSFVRLTKTESQEGGLTWSKDGTLLFFSSEDKLEALSVGKTGLFDLAKPTMKDGNVNMIDLADDGKRVLFSESTNEGLPDFIVPRYTGKEVTSRSFKSGVNKNKIGLTPVDTGKTIWISLPGDERYFLSDGGFAPDGKKVFIERVNAERKKRELFVADTDSGKARLVFEELDKAWVEGGLYSTHWMPDGKHIITTTEKDGWNHLYSMTPEGHDLKKFTDGEWEIRWFEIDPSGERIFFLANRDDHAQWQLYAYELRTNNVTKLSSREGTYESPRLSKDGTFIISLYSNFGKPSEFVRTATSGSLNAETQLTNSVSEEFNKINWVIPEIVHFKSKDGTSVPAMIYKPHDFSPAKKYPVVVFVHGAGYLQNVYRGWSYYYREYLFHHRLTQRGYVVLEIEYRGSAGLGRKFRTDVYMHLGGKDLQDEVDGLEYLKSLGYIDPQRVGIYGGSYGGFMALMGIFLTDQYTCAAALRAVTSWENYYRHNSWYTEARLGKPEENKEAYKISSPITYADSLKRPLLILHGMVDDNVFFQDAVQLINKLQKSGKKFEAMMYPEEAHSFTEPESWLDEYSRIEEFFDRNLSPAGK
jgi:dipeptidyl aminopeptidase/acylaminoacyl peptidase